MPSAFFIHSFRLMDTKGLVVLSALQTSDGHLGSPEMSLINILTMIKLKPVKPTLGNSEI